jgi:hypothetical protein
MGDAPLGAGILGGSGSHVVQIIIAIVVAAAFVGYFLFRVAGRVRQTPQRGPVVRRRAGRGRRLPVSRSEDMANVGGGTRPAGPLDLTQTRVNRRHLGVAR